MERRPFIDAKTSSRVVQSPKLGEAPL
jgi:hypothetical protein